MPRTSSSPSTPSSSHTSYIRFHAPPESCAAYARAILADHNAKHPDRPVPADLAPLINPPAAITSTKLPISWFAPHTIQAGLHGGTRGSHAPQVWVDTDRGIFYYRLTD